MNDQETAPRHPHQLIPGPTVHRNYVDIVVAYVNHLEEKVDVYEREWAASVERNQPHINNLEQQMEDVRNKNTALEHENRTLKAEIDTLRGQIDTLQCETIVQDWAAEQSPKDVTHPWDMTVTPTRDNPLGFSAREIINSYMHTVRDLEAHIESYKRQVEKTPSENVKPVTARWADGRPLTAEELEANARAPVAVTREQLEAQSRDSLAKYLRDTREPGRGE